MIIRLNYNKNLYDVIEFIQRCPDTYQDFYITKERNRLFLAESKIKTIQNILKYQDIFGLFEKDLKAILIVYKNKGFRTFLKILSENRNYYHDLLKFVNWNVKQEIYLKIKKSNPINKVIWLYYDKIKHKTVYRYGWEFLGLRGAEILYVRKPRQEKKYDSSNSEIKRPIK